MLDGVLGVACGDRAMFGDGLRRRRASAEASPATALSRPQSSAVAASSWRSSMISWVARERPMARVSRCSPPARGNPSASGCHVMRQSSVATRRSVHNASSKPPLARSPVIAAMVGCGNSANGANGSPGSSCSADACQIAGDGWSNTTRTSSSIAAQQSPSWATKLASRESPPPITTRSPSRVRSRPLAVIWSVYRDRTFVFPLWTWRTVLISVIPDKLE